MWKVFFLPPIDTLLLLLYGFILARLPSTTSAPRRRRGGKHIGDIKSAYCVPHFNSKITLPTMFAINPWECTTTLGVIRVRWYVRRRREALGERKLWTLCVMMCRRFFHTTNANVPIQLASRQLLLRSPRFSDPFANYQRHDDTLKILDSLYSTERGLKSKRIYHSTSTTIYSHASGFIALGPPNALLSTTKIIHISLSSW